ncbi:hypothetical protein KUL72_07835 [Bradyrhizobium arachidis]|uniref:hypothetical protein n=1 Tax=Bradyrhizobium arachidis TaxID=858423 RepID=UPI002162B953|nr:hypothetical protein [Bradyrhizobium arachidis]UVO38264.1 hypothetical protein KUL72_07835 [Bradyrhizobium arachidis]
MSYKSRRRALLHFEARAANAVYCAKVLHEAEGRGAHEGFLREASLALELIVKAVITQRLEVGEDLGIITRVPANHNVPQLWADAKLPKPSPDDYGRLVRARVYLMWAGRYPAPNKDEHGDRDHDDIWEHAYERMPNSELFRKPHSFNYEDVDRIFGVARDCFWLLRHEHDL